MCCVVHSRKVLSYVRVFDTSLTIQYAAFVKTNTSDVVSAFRSHLIDNPLLCHLILNYL